MAKIRATGKNIVVKVKRQSKAGSIIIPSTAQEFIQYHGNIYGVVVAVGPDYPYDVKVGDKIIFRRHEGVKVEDGDDMYVSLEERFVDAVYEEE
jgi:co-chaperonin GroES (HSP10)